MKNIILKEDDISDIDKLDDYNNDYINYYDDFTPFATPDNYVEILKNNELIKQGINNNGIKEIYYWAMEDNKIIGHASVRLNPELDKNVLKYAGHVMYGVIPSKRKKGYGSLICHLLIQKMHDMGYKKIFITCNEDNIGSNIVIKNNSGKLLEVIDPDGVYATHKTCRYLVDTEESLNNFKQKSKTRY